MSTEQHHSPTERFLHAIRAHDSATAIALINAGEINSEELKKCPPLTTSFLIDLYNEGGDYCHERLLYFIQHYSHRIKWQTTPPLPLTLVQTLLSSEDELLRDNFLSLKNIPAAAINATNASKQNALHTAAQRKNWEALLQLADIKGANLWAVDENKKLPISYVSDPATRRSLFQKMEERYPERILTEAHEADFQTCIYSKNVTRLIKIFEHQPWLIEKLIEKPDFFLDLTSNDAESLSALTTSWLDFNLALHGTDAEALKPWAEGDDILVPKNRDNKNPEPRMRSGLPIRMMAKNRIRVLEAQPIALPPVPLAASAQSTESAHHRASSAFTRSSAESAATSAPLS